MYQEMDNNKERAMKKQLQVYKQKITEETGYYFAYVLDSPMRRKDMRKETCRHQI